MSKHDKRAARFGGEVRREAVYARLAKADRRYDRWMRGDRRRAGRAILKERRQVLAALRMMPELAESVRRALGNITRWMQQFAELVRAGEPFDLSAVAP